MTQIDPDAARVQGTIEEKIHELEPPTLPSDLPEVPGVAAIPEELEALLKQPVEEPAEDGGPSWLSKFRGIWGIIEVAIEKAIEAAEVLFDGEKRGAEKKSWVTDQAMEYLRMAEQRADFIPSWLEGVAFRVLEMSLDFTIEQVVKRLKGSGRL